MCPEDNSLYFRLSEHFSWIILLFECLLEMNFSITKQRLLKSPSSIHLAYFASSDLQTFSKFIYSRNISFVDYCTFLVLW